MSLLVHLLYYSVCALALYLCVDAHARITKVCSNDFVGLPLAFTALPIAAKTCMFCVPGSVGGQAHVLPV